MFNGQYSSLNHVGAFTFLYKVNFLDSIYKDCPWLKDGKRETVGAIVRDAVMPAWRVIDGEMGWERI